MYNRASVHQGLMHLMHLRTSSTMTHGQGVRLWLQLSPTECHYAWSCGPSQCRLPSLAHAPTSHPLMLASSFVTSLIPAAQPPSPKAPTSTSIMGTPRDADAQLYSHPMFAAAVLSFSSHTPDSAAIAKSLQPLPPSKTGLSSGGQRHLCWCECAHV